MASQITSAAPWPTPAGTDGVGSAGVVIDSAPTEGVRVTPLPRLRSFPALKNPADIHKAVAVTAEEFHYAFTNGLSGEDPSGVGAISHADVGKLLWRLRRTANLRPSTNSWVDTARTITC